MDNKLWRIAKYISEVEVIFLIKKIRNSLVYLYDKEDNLRLYKRNLDNERVKKVSPMVVSNIWVSPHSHRITFAEDVAKGKRKYLLWEYDPWRERLRNLKNNPSRTFTVVYDEITDEGIYCTVGWNGENKRLLRLDNVILFSDIKNNVVIGVYIHKDSTQKVMGIDLRSGDVFKLTTKEGVSCGFPIFCDDRIIFSISKGDEETLVKWKPWKKTFKTLELPSADWKGYREYAYLYDKTYKNLITLDLKDGKNHSFLNGKKIHTPPRCILQLKVDNGEVYGVHYSFSSPPRILKLYPEIVGNYSVRISKGLPRKVKSVKFHGVESFDNFKIPTFVLRAEKRRAPTIVYVHGGPRYDERNTFNLSILKYVFLSYNVGVSNFRNSAGYGKSFRKLDVGDMGNGDPKDVIYVSRWALENNNASKLAITGGGYGGYMTFWAICNEPQIYKCGVALSSISGWEEALELGAPVFKEFFNIMFKGDRDLMKERSPYQKCENIQNPSCLIYSQNDSGAPLLPILKLAEKLSKNGKDYKLHVFPMVGHFSVTAGSETVFKAILEGFSFIEGHFKKG